MGRRTEGRAVIADYSVWTVELSRDELMIILDGQKNHRINRAKRKLQFLRAQRDLHRGYGQIRNKQINQKISMEKTIKTADEINSETVLALEKKYGKQAVEEIDRVLRECHERVGDVHFNVFRYYLLKRRFRHSLDNR